MRCLLILHCRKSLVHGAVWLVLLGLTVGVQLMPIRQGLESPQLLPRVCV